MHAECQLFLMRLGVMQAIVKCFRDNISQQLRLLNHLPRTHDRNEDKGLYAFQIACWRMRVQDTAMGNFELFIEQREICGI